MDLRFRQRRGWCAGHRPERPGCVVGVPQARKLLEDIPNKVRDVLGIMVNVNLREQNGKDYLEIRVEPYPSPISYKGEYYYRSGSTKQEFKGTALERFLLKNRGRHWDDAPEPSFIARSCSPAAIRLFKQRATESGHIDRSSRRDSPPGAPREPGANRKARPETRRLAAFLRPPGENMLAGPGSSRFFHDG